MNLPAAAADLRRDLVGTPFGRYTIGNAASLLGVWTHLTSIGWLTWQMIESGSWLGLMAFAELFPAIVVNPCAGVASIRMDRIRLMKIAQAGSALVASLISLFYLIGVLNVWLLFGLAVLLGICSSTALPLRMTVVSVLVSRGDLRLAVTVNSIAFNLARFIGPMISGLLIVTIDVGAALVLHAVCYLIFLAMLSTLPPTPKQRAARDQSVLAEMVEGVVYLVAHPGLRSIMVMVVTLGAFLRPVTELLPGFSEQVFNSGAAGLAILSSSIGIGALFGGLGSAAINRNGIMAVIVANLVATLCLAAFASVDNLWVGAVLLMFVGASMTTTGIASHTLIHLAVDDSVRGRVLSTYGMVLRVGPALGALVIGFASDRVGLQWALVLPLPSCILACAHVYLRRDAISE